MQMLFEDENEVLQATALPQVSQCTQRVEAWLSIIQSGALHFVRQCGVSSVLVPLRCVVTTASTSITQYLESEEVRTSIRSQDVNIPLRTALKDLAFRAIQRFVHRELMERVTFVNHGVIVIRFT